MTSTRIKKDKMLQVRVSSKQWEQIELIADKRGLSFSETVRWLLSETIDKNTE